MSAKTVTITVPIWSSKVVQMADDLLAATCMRDIRLMNEDGAEIGIDEIQKIAAELVWKKGWTK